MCSYNNGGLDQVALISFAYISPQLDYEIYEIRYLDLFIFIYLHSFIDLYIYLYIQLNILLSAYYMPDTDRCWHCSE